MSRRSGVVVDERTLDMDPDHLLCRAYGHQRVPVPPSPRRRGELLRLGQAELRLSCTRCGQTKYELLSLDGEVLERRADPYPEGYLMPKGSGRLARGSAKIAWMSQTKLI